MHYSSLFQYFFSIYYGPLKIPSVLIDCEMSAELHHSLAHIVHARNF